LTISMIGRCRLHRRRLWLLPSAGRCGRGTDGFGIAEESFKGGLASRFDFLFRCFTRRWGSISALQNLTGYFVSQGRLLTRLEDTNTSSLSSKVNLSLLTSLFVWCQSLSVPICPTVA
jgi:hypothetical protein